MRRRRRQPGFVLLLVLVLLATAAALLALVARQTSRRALEAGARTRDVQRRWAVRGLEALCFARAEAILTGAAREGEPPPAAARVTVTLGGTPFDVVVADEQAKANVNRLAAEGGGERIIEAASALSEGRWVLQVVLRPVEMKTDEIRTPPMRFASLEQVFSAAGPADLLGAGPDRPGPVQRLTCWGNGRVNLARAAPAVLRTALGDVLTEYDLFRLAALRDETPGGNVKEILGQLGLEDKVRAEAERRLTDSSACYSVWITAREKTRAWHRLGVRQQGDAENDAGRWTFVW